jgi:hypothetical protein
MSRQRIAVASVLTVCIVGLGLAAAPDPDVAWYQFDEGTGDLATDQTGNGHDGEIQGAAWVDGGWNGLGWCLDFDGNDDRVEIGAVDVEGTGITLAAWVQPDSFNINDGRVISKANEWGENDHWWMMSTINQSFLRFRLKTVGQNTTTLIASQGQLEIGEWQHAAATWDGGTMRLYRNSMEVAGVAKDGDAVATDPKVKAAIASQPKGAYATDPLHANKFFDGRVDEVRIYSYALSQAQLGELIQGLHPTAWKPDPADRAVGVMQPLLRWEPSDTGVLHNVYLGTSPELGPGDLVAPNHGMKVYWHPLGLEPGVTYYWRIDDIEVGGAVITGRVWSFTSATPLASQPQPADGAKWVDPTAVTLSWLIGRNALSHDVYFGTSAEDVAAGAGDTSKGNQPQMDFDPGLLQEETTYYWRIDEVGVGDVRQTGVVWSFTTAGPGGGLKGEYFSNPDLEGMPALVRIDPGVNFTWGTVGPGDPLPGSGYSVRWSGDLEAAFTETYTVSVYADDGVKLWFNGELVVDKWFGQEAGSPRYGVAVDLEAGQRYPIVMEYFFNSGNATAELSWASPHTPEQIIPAGALSLLVRAHSPNPAQRAVNVGHSPTLAWRAGENAAEHDVYFGDDQEAVANATTDSADVYQGRQALDATSFDPGALEWNKTYFWRVDEVNDASADSPWTGSVWSFTTADFIVVDDFESYTDNYDAGEAIWQAWIDGLENNTGSIVGYMEAREGTFGERQTVHGGRQSMPFDYDNAGAPFYSEAERTWATPQDWTANGANTLVLHLKGKADNSPDPLYVAVEDGAGHATVVTHPDSALATLTTWRQWKIPLSDFSAAGVGVTAVKKMRIGFGNPSAPAAGGAGLVFIDDIWVVKE